MPDEFAPDVAGAQATLLSRPEEVRALVAGGRPVLWAGADTPAPEARVPAAQDLRRRGPERPDRRGKTGWAG